MNNIPICRCIKMNNKMNNIPICRCTKMNNLPICRCIKMNNIPICRYIKMNSKMNNIPICRCIKMNNKMNNIPICRCMKMNNNMNNIPICRCIKTMEVIVFMVIGIIGIPMTRFKWSFLLENFFQCRVSSCDAKNQTLKKNCVTISVETRSDTFACSLRTLCSLTLYQCI